MSEDKKIRKQEQEQENGLLQVGAMQLDELPVRDGRCDGQGPHGAGKPYLPMAGQEAVFAEDAPFRRFPCGLGKGFGGEPRHEVGGSDRHAAPG